MNDWLKDITWRLPVGLVIWTLFYMAMLETVFDQPWDRALIESLVANALIVASAVVSHLVVRYYEPKGDRFWYFIGVAIVSGIIAVFLYGYAMTLLIGDAGGADQLEKFRFFHGGFAFLANAMSIWVGRNHLRWAREGEAQERQLETERLAREAELLKLRHQLQPHFLFNSLNSINALISSKPAEARTMVHQLSDFLRGTIKAEQHQTIPLNQELEYLSLYLEIEQVRFGHRLKTRVEASEESRSAVLPSLLLQPIMENAIKFGLYGTTEAVEITMQASVEAGMLTIKVTNPVDEDADSQTGTGFGLNSIRRRLHLLYGRNDLLETTKEEHRFTASVKIPQRS